MARNGTGVFAVANPVLVGALRSSTAVNQNYGDAGNEITNTLPLDGTATMAGQFRAAPGTAAAPGITFGSDLNVGFRRRGPDSMAWVSGGVDRFYIDENGKAWITGNKDIAGALTVNGAFTGESAVGLLEAFASNGLARQTLNGDSEEITEPDQGTIELTFIRDGNGTVLPTGVLGDIRVPVACTLTGAWLLGNAVGSISVDIWKDTLANYPPLVGDSIVGGSPLVLSNAQAVEDTALSGWTTSFAAGDCLRFNINSVSTITRIAIGLRVKRFP